MKVLAPAVLMLEAIAVALAIPVAVSTSARGAVAGWVLAAIAIALVLAAGMARRPSGVAVGSALQVAVLASGLIVPAMFALGLIFLAVWDRRAGVREQGRPGRGPPPGGGRLGRAGPAHPGLRRRSTPRADRLGAVAARGARLPNPFPRSTPVSERTLVLVKPDGVARGLVGEVITRLERKGLRLVAVELRSRTGHRRGPTTPSTASGRSSARSSTSSPRAR